MVWNRENVLINAIFGNQTNLALKQMSNKFGKAY